MARYFNVALREIFVFCHAILFTAFTFAHAIVLEAYHRRVTMSRKFSGAYFSSGDNQVADDASISSASSITYRYPCSVRNNWRLAENSWSRVSRVTIEWKYASPPSCLG